MWMISQSRFRVAARFGKRWRQLGIASMVDRCFSTDRPVYLCKTIPSLYRSCSPVLLPRESVSIVILVMSSQNIVGLIGG